MSALIRLFKIGYVVVAVLEDETGALSTVVYRRDRLSGSEKLSHDPFDREDLRHLLKAVHRAFRYVYQGDDIGPPAFDSQAVERRRVVSDRVRDAFARRVP